MSGGLQQTKDPASVLKGWSESVPDTSVMKPPPVVERLEKGMKTPICVIMVGMAGSGKTTLLAQLQRSMNNHCDEPSPNRSGEEEAQHEQQQNQQQGEEQQQNKAESYEQTTKLEGESNDNSGNNSDNNSNNPAPTQVLPTYCINLDPATLNVPYDVSIDIRDTVNYKEVMKQHNLGPNGAIMTSLNLFATKFDQVMSILEKRAYNNNENTGKIDNDDGGCTDEGGGDDDKDPSTSSMEYILVDTPGQIEAFTWSASGTIISESLASAFPTVLCFVVDTVRCASSPNTFMSNMLYACSMFYRTRLPLVIAFNKTDIVPHHFAMEWMTDYEAFQQALDDAMEQQSMGFYGSLTRSLSMVLDEFYAAFAKHTACGVSAATGQGLDDFWKVVQYAANHDFAIDYIQDLKNRMEEQLAKKQAIARSDIRRLQRDLQQQEEEG